MPVVTCPNCSAKLNAPAAAAGKRVKCPKCQTPVAVPGEVAFEVVEDDAPLPKPAKPSRDESDAPKKKPRIAPPVDDSDEEAPRKKRRAVLEDEDDEDDRPRKKKKSPLLPILIGVGVLGLLVVAGGIYYLVTPSAPVPLGTTGPAGPTTAANVNNMPGITLPQGWVEFNDPRNEIRLFWPKGQPTKGANQKIEDAGGKDTETWMQESNGKVYTLIRSTLPDGEVKPGAEAATLETTVKGMISAMPGASEVRKSTEVEGGNPYRVSTIDIPSAKKRIFVRMTLVKNRLIILMITASNNNNVYWATEGDTAPFFQSLWPK
jgi:hypothetical protein